MPVHADGRQAGTLAGVALDLPTRSVSHALYGRDDNGQVVALTFSDGRVDDERLSSLHTLSSSASERLPEAVRDGAHANVPRLPSAAARRWAPRNRCPVHGHRGARRHDPNQSPAVL